MRNGIGDVGLTSISIASPRDVRDDAGEKDNVTLLPEEEELEIDIIKIMAAKFIGSTAYMILCAVMVAFTTILVVYMILYPNMAAAHRPWWFITLEVLVTAMIMAEVLAHMYVAGQAYWKSWWNRLDFFIMIVCILSLTEYISELWEELGEAQDAILSLRYVIQALRLCTLIRITQKQKYMVEAREEQQVDFSSLELDAGDADEPWQEIITSPLGELEHDSPRLRPSQDRGLMDIDTELDDDDDNGENRAFGSPNEIGTPRGYHRGQDSPFGSVRVS